MMEIKEEVLKAMVEALECNLALDAPYREGIVILAKHGYDEKNRFDFPATKFVKFKNKEALTLLRNM